MKITYDLMLRTLNRFKEVGGFEMQCLSLDYDNEEEAFKDFVDKLLSKDTDEIDGHFRKYMLMSDEEFNRPWTKFKAKAAIEYFDINHRPNSINIFKLF